MFPIVAQITRTFILRARSSVKVNLRTQKIRRVKSNLPKMIRHAFKSFRHTSSVIMQKDESQDGCFKKAKHAKISEKQTFLIP